MPQHIYDNVLSWATDLDEQTKAQAGKTANLPFVCGHLALMPDAHFGLGSTVGSVIPTRGAIIPAAIGVDIGCGMVAAKLNITASQLPDNLDAFLSRIGQYVPSGVGGQNQKPLDAAGSFVGEKGIPVCIEDSENKVLQQYGSLGSGNHFVELCVDESDDVWIVLHSGSRGPGNMIAQRHIEKAKGLMKQYFINLEDPNLAYLVEGTREFDSYIDDMLWAQDYALENRGAMLLSVWKAFQETIYPASLKDVINCHHNFTQREQVDGKPTWVTRKGAIQARSGSLGVIPGSMGTSTFIVEGKGSRASYASCSHGAGRKMSRKKAKDQFSEADLNALMEGKTWNAANADKLIDEIPSSYKDIHEVMENQKDLVEIKHTLNQVLNFKGV